MEAAFGRHVIPDQELHDRHPVVQQDRRMWFVPVDHAELSVHGPENGRPSGCFRLRARGKPKHNTKYSRSDLELRLYFGM